MKAIVVLFVLTCGTALAEEALTPEEQAIVDGAKDYLSKLPPKEAPSGLRSRMQSEMESYHEEENWCHWALTKKSGKIKSFKESKKMLKGNCEQTALDAFYSDKASNTKVMIRASEAEEWQPLETE